MALGDQPLVEPRFGLFLSIIRSGGAVHDHRDFSPPGTRHLRCNLFLDLPEQGGRPVILEEPIHVAPRMLLAFYANDAAFVRAVRRRPAHHPVVRLHRPLIAHPARRHLTGRPALGGGDPALWSLAPSRHKSRV